MRIASWNINGLRSVVTKGALRAFVDLVDPDILCMQEVKIKPAQVDFSLSGYKLMLNSADRAGYSGTGFLVKDKLDIDESKVLLNLPSDIAECFHLGSDSFGNPNTEGRTMTIDLDDLYVVTVYTPNSKGDLERLPLRYNQWDPAFLDYMERLRKIKPVIFCGDLNVAAEEIDLANPKQNIGKHGFTDQERAGFRRYLDAGFIDSFRLVNGNKTDQYTWWTHWAHARERNVGWRIDYAMVDVRLSNRIGSAVIHSSQMGSDHCPISVDIVDSD